MSGQVAGIPPGLILFGAPAQLILPASCLAVFLIQRQIQRQWQGQIQRQWQGQTQRHSIWSFLGHIWYCPSELSSFQPLSMLGFMSEHKRSLFRPATLQYCVIFISSKDTTHSEMTYSSLQYLWLSIHLFIWGFSLRQMLNSNCFFSDTILKKCFFVFETLPPW